MTRKLIGLSLLATVSLSATFVRAQSKVDRDRHDPTRLSKLPFEGEPPQGVVPESPTDLHPQDRAGEIAAVAPVAVSFLDAVRMSAESPPPALIQSHIQGEFLQEQLTERSFPLSDVLQPEAAMPEGDGSIEPLAPGDSVAEFDGLANTGWIPPDTVMAVGPNHIVEAVNSGFAVYNKGGTQLQGYTTFASFFASVLPANWDGFLFDPRVIYSAEHSRFAMLVLGKDDTNLSSYFFLAFPQTSDPTGTWWVYGFNHQSVPTADSDSWADYCGLGADTWGVYVTCNVFLWTNSFKYAKLWSLDTGGFSGGSINGWLFWDLRWNDNSFAFSLQPAIPHTIAGDQATFFVNTFSGSGNAALLWKLTGDRTNSPTLTRATVTTPTYNAVGENVDQPGTTANLDAGDARVMNAVYSSRHVFTVLTDDIDNNGARAGWLTLKLDVDASSLSWSDLLTPANGIYYFYPAITMEGAVGGANGNLAVFGSWTDAETVQSAATKFASALFKIYTAQPTSTAGPFINYHDGLDAYELRDGGGRNRWGDYSGAGFDWSTGNVWGAAEYAGTANTWRTRIKGAEIADAGCTPDGFEPDDTSIQATGIGTDGTAQTHNICPVGDDDWVTFTLAAESDVLIETSGPSGDTRMWLYDSGLNEIEFNDDGGSGLFSLIDRACGVDPMPAGTYFVRVDEFGDDDEIGTYNLAVTATDCGCVPDAWEPDDNSGQANIIGTTGTAQTHNICPAGDEDWVSFTIASESDVLIETSGPSGDTRIWLYDSSLNQIEFNDDGGTGLFSLIDRSCSIDALPAGTYFVQVDEFNDDDVIETYDLAVTATDCACVPDGWEPDDNGGQASVIGSGSPQEHNICPVGDEDWVTFTLPAESEVQLATSGPLGDTRMWLYDSGLNQIEFDDDSGSGLFSFIDRTCALDPLPAGTYFVQIDEFGDNDEIDSYELAYDLVGQCCVEDLVIDNDTITGTQSFTAGNNVTLGPSLVVNGTSIDVRAGVGVVIVNGVEIGGTFSAGIDPQLICP